MPEMDNFEKARYEYCVQQFDRQLKRFFELDSKGRIYLIIITVLLSGIVLNYNLLTALSTFLISKQLPAYIFYFIAVTLISLILSVFLALVTAMRAITLKKYTNEFPDKLVSALFESNEYLEKHHAYELYKVAALRYAISFEELKEACDEKARWIDKCSVIILISVGLLIVLVTTLFIVALN